MCWNFNYIKWNLLLYLIKELKFWNIRFGIGSCIFIWFKFRVNIDEFCLFVLMFWVFWFLLFGYLVIYVFLLLGLLFGFEDLLYLGGVYKIDIIIIYEIIDELLFNKRW